MLKEKKNCVRTGRQVFHDCALCAGCGNPAFADCAFKAANQASIDYNQAMHDGMQARKDAYKRKCADAAKRFQAARRARCKTTA